MPGSLVLALVLALGTGWVCIGFIFVIEKVMVAAYDTGGHDALARFIGSADFVQILTSLVVGGACVGLLTHYLIPEQTNVGFNGVLKAARTREGHISWQEGLGVGLSSAISIGCGASVGRYGPAVHIGAAMGSYFGSVLHLEVSAVLTLLAAGSAAAIAASFHAPFAGVLFAHEVILKDYDITAFAPVTLAAVVGMLVGENHNGGRSVFWFDLAGVMESEVLGYGDVAVAALVGALSAGGSLCFMLGLDKGQRAMAGLQA